MAGTSDDPDELVAHLRGGRYVHGASSAELLDLVRSAEEGALVAADATSGAAGSSGDIVDVDDDAVEAPPSSAGSTRNGAAQSERRPALPPFAGIVLLLALAVGVLAVLAR